MEETPSNNSETTSNVDNVEKPIKLVIIDQSRDALDAARDKADARLAEELDGGNGFQRFLNGIWKGNIAKDYYRQKYISEARITIEVSQDVLVHEVSEDLRKRAIESTIERFQGEYEELTHSAAGEKREVQENNSELTIGMKGLIGRYCKGELNNETLPEEKTRLLEAYREKYGKDKLGEGVVVVDNLMKVAQAVAGAVEHGESLDNVLNNLQVISGEARAGVRTEVRHNKIDKAIDNLSKSRVGSLLGPEVVATLATVATSIARVGSHSVVGAITKTILPGAAAGAWAGLRENRRMKDERAQHSREMAQGKEYDEGTKRRMEIENTRYDTISANDLTDHLRLIGAEDKMNEGGKDALQAAMDALAAIEARVQYSDEQKIDLISFTDSARVGDERLALDIARAELKVALESRLTNGIRQELQLDQSASLHEILNKQSEDYLEIIKGGISKKDECFKKLKAHNVAKAVAIGVISGVTLGLIAQEGMAAVDSTRVGLIEQLWDAHNTTMGGGVERQTVLNGLFSGDHLDHTALVGNHVTHSFGTNSEMSISGGDKIVDNSDGTFSIVDAKGSAVAENIAIGHDGQLSQESIDQLSKLGMTVEDKSFDTNVVTIQSQEVSVGGYIQNHISETTHVSRDLWYDNDTSGVFDKNEIGLQWGGDNGVIGNGYGLNINAMTPGGSYHDGQSVDWNEIAKNGNMKLAISASADTQTQVFMVDIGLDGHVSIPADSPAGHFFSNNGGHAEFHGAYAEVVQTIGADENGTEHIRSLATLVGDRSAESIVDKIPVEAVEHHAVYDIIQQYTEMAPVIPVESRKSLEAVKSRIERVNNYLGNEYLSRQEKILRRSETSPRLADNPNVNLIPAQEYAWYKKLLFKKRGEKYINEIENAISISPELSDLSPDLKTIIAIPVNAAGKSESENIYNVLTKGYGKQSVGSLKNNLMVLHVNWFDNYTEGDTTQRENIQKTRSEIERAKNDNPDLKIAVVETEWKRSDIQGGVIGYVASKLNDTILMALERATSGGKMDGSHDVLIMRNDADPVGVSVNYIANFQRDFGESPETDIFKGTTSFDNTKADRLPGFVFVSNFMQSMDLLSGSRRNAIHTGGANFGVRASTLAAIGSIGFDVEHTGAGSDDVNIGRRVKSARGNKTANTKEKVQDNTAYYQEPDSSGKKESRRIIAKRVFGARIDTDSDRGEKMYEQGVPFANQWDREQGFDKNGYQPRNSGLGGQMSESIIDNYDEMIERIRNDMERSINVMIERDDNGVMINQNVVMTALRLAFPRSRIRGGDGFELKDMGPDKKSEFIITPSGAKYLQSYFTRNSSGRKDLYGKRKMRQLYGQNNDISKARLAMNLTR